MIEELIIKELTKIKGRMELLEAKINLLETKLGAHKAGGMTQQELTDLINVLEKTQ